MIGETLSPYRIESGMADVRWTENDPELSALDGTERFVEPMRWAKGS